VTEKAGVGAEGLYGQGVAVGDIDNDGYPDLYVTGYGRSILYHNNGNGTFTDVTEKAGVADKGGWANSAGWVDYEQDGYIDLLRLSCLVRWSPMIIGSILLLLRITMARLRILRFAPAFKRPMTASTRRRWALTRLTSTSARGWTPTSHPSISGSTGSTTTSTTI